MRQFIVALACLLVSADTPEPPAPEPETIVVSKNVLVAVQAFIFMTSNFAFDGDRHGVYDAIKTLGDDFDRLFIETRGPIGDLKIEVQPGVEIKVRDYFDRVTAFANLAETT